MHYACRNVLTRYDEVRQLPAFFDGAHILPVVFLYMLAHISTRVEKLRGDEDDAVVEDGRDEPQTHDHPGDPGLDPGGTAKQVQDVASARHRRDRVVEHQVSVNDWLVIPPGDLIS